MKFSKKLWLPLLMAGLLTGVSGCSRVEPNKAGVLMENYGRNGKNDFSIVSGIVWTVIPGTELYLVPLWEQRGKFEKDVTLKAADNTEFSASPMYSFRVIKDRAVDVVFDNKQLDIGNSFIASLQDNILEPKIYDLMKEESRRFSTESLMASGGSLTFEERVQKLVGEEFKKRGLELMTFSSQLEFSDAVKGRIDKRNEVSTNLSVLDQQIEEEKKRLELAKLEAATNKARGEGLTKEILTQQFIQKWDGKTPIYGSVPFAIMKQE